MAKHIGIVACSAEGAALCYRTICLEAAGRMGRHSHPQLSMHTHCLAEYLRHQRRGDWPAVAGQRGYRRLGVLGTCCLMEGGLYTQAAADAGLEVRIPAEPHRRAIDRIIFGELVCGQVPPESREMLLEVMAALKAEGCDSAVLGCTELPLLAEGTEPPLPTLYSTRILARAALREALG